MMASTFFVSFFLLLLFLSLEAVQRGGRRVRRNNKACKSRFLPDGGRHQVQSKYRKRDRKLLNRSFDTLLKVFKSQERRNTGKGKRFRSLLVKVMKRCMRSLTLHKELFRETEG